MMMMMMMTTMAITTMTEHLRIVLHNFPFIAGVFPDL
jgi:hypothetical protein